MKMMEIHIDERVTPAPKVLRAVSNNRPEVAEIARQVAEWERELPSQTVYQRRLLERLKTQLMQELCYLDDFQKNPNHFVEQCSGGKHPSTRLIRNPVSVAIDGIRMQIAATERALAREVEKTRKK